MNRTKIIQISRQDALDLIATEWSRQDECFDFIVESVVKDHKYFYYIPNFTRYKYLSEMLGANYGAVNFRDRYAYQLRKNSSSSYRQVRYSRRIAVSDVDAKGIRKTSMRNYRIQTWKGIYTEWRNLPVKVAFD